MFLQHLFTVQQCLLGKETAYSHRDCPAFPAPGDITKGRVAPELFLSHQLPEELVQSSRPESVAKSSSSWAARPKQIGQLLGLKEILQLTRKSTQMNFGSPEALGPCTFSTTHFSLLSLLTANGLGLGWAAGTHIVLDWHFVLLKDGKLLVNGRDLCFHGGQFVLQGLHELQTDPELLRVWGRRLILQAGEERGGGWEGQAYSPTGGLSQCAPAHRRPVRILLRVLLQVGVQLRSRLAAISLSRVVNLFCHSLQCYQRT